MLKAEDLKGRQVISHMLALRLKEPTESIYTQSNIYAKELHSVDTGVRIIIDRAPEEVNENPEFEKQLYVNILILYETCLLPLFKQLIHFTK